MNIPTIDEIKHNPQAINDYTKGKVPVQWLSTVKENVKLGKITQQEADDMINHVANQ